MLVGYTETSKIELSTLNDFRYPFNLGTLLKGLQPWKPPMLETSNLGTFPTTLEPFQPGPCNPATTATLTRSPSKPGPLLEPR